MCQITLIAQNTISDFKRIFGYSVKGQSMGQFRFKTSHSKDKKNSAQSRT